MLTAETLKELVHYDPETGIFTWRRTLSNRAQQGHSAGTYTQRGYVVITIARRRMQAHRLAWLYVHGADPEGVIDHIDGNAANNAICNLRVVAQAVNTKNNKIAVNNTSGHPGVYLNRRTNRWYAQIWDGMKCLSLGTFDTKHEAISVRKIAENQLGYVVRS